MTDQFSAEVSGIGSLADPVRRALYEHVAGAAEPVSRDQAARATGVARHTAKFHLDRLVEEGLLETEYRRLSGRRGPGAGRPSKLYRRAARQFAVSLPPRRYELAGQILAKALDESAARGTSPADAVADAARSMGQQLAREVGAARDDPAGSGSGQAGGTASHAALDELADVLERCGYEPRVAHEGARHCVELANCPFHSLAREHTQLVCGMNFSLLHSLAEGLGHGDDVELRLDPAPGRCCVTVVGAA